MNITDVDDKTIRDSKKEGISLKKFTKKYENAFKEDLKTLNISFPDKFTRATEHIPEMVGMIQKLIMNGLAYKGEDGSIYFSVSKFRGYGKLSKIKVDELKSGARVKQDEYEKEQVNDFALWKAWDKDDGDVFWENKLGKGRPGWHIECSAMSTKYLGEQFDIHTGGTDLVFPHHENEIAQSEGASGKKPFVKYWLHNEWLLVEGKKMSKSLGNFYTLRDLLKKGCDPMAVKYVLLSTHYRQQMNFTFKDLEAASASLDRLKDFVQKLREKKIEKESILSDIIKKSRAEFIKAMDDDLEISKALAVIFNFVRDLNKVDLTKEDAAKAFKLMKEIDSVLALGLTEETKIPKKLKELIEQREEARRNKNFKTADKIRDDLLSKGVVLEDTKDGVRWKSFR